MVDQAAQMTELSSLIPIAWYNPVAWLFASDDCQLGPHLVLDVVGKYPFRPDLENSTLARAVKAGAANAYLYTNHRQYGRLFSLPS